MVEVEGKSMASNNGGSNFRDAAKQLGGCFYEREEEIEALILAVLSGNNAYALGTPGVGKSMLIEAIAGLFRDADYFDVLAHKFATPDDFFGPVSLPDLKQGHLKRNTQGYLPTANFAFVDEIFKAGSGVLNTLLRIANERTYKDDTKTVAVPLVTMMAASNELPQEDDLPALYDRFLVRLNVEPIKDRGNRVKLLSGQLPSVQGILTMGDLKDAQEEVREVEISEAVAEAAVELYESIAEKGLKVSDRRLKNSMGLVRAHAFLYGRKRAMVGDLIVLRHTLWSKPEEIRLVNDVVLDKCNPAMRKAREAVARITAAVAQAKKQPEGPERMMEFVNLLPNLNKELKDLIAYRDEAEAAGQDATIIEKAIEQLEDVRKDNFSDLIGPMVSTRRRKNGKMALPKEVA